MKLLGLSFEFDDAHFLSQHRAGERGERFRVCVAAVVWGNRFGILQCLIGCGTMLRPCLLFVLGAPLVAFLDALRFLPSLPGGCPSVLLGGACLPVLCMSVAGL